MLPYFLVYFIFWTATFCGWFMMVAFQMIPHWMFNSFEFRGGVLRAASMWIVAAYFLIYFPLGTFLLIKYTP